MFSVIYMGYSDVIMQYLIESPDFMLHKVIGVKGRMNAGQYELIRRHNIAYMELSNREELMKAVSFMEKESIVIIYKFDFIIPPVLISQYDFFNFHGGNLRYNRGANAPIRSILNLDSETCLSLYKLTGGIDEGVLIDEYKVLISKDETPQSLNQKMVKGIPHLLRQLVEYLQGRRKGELLTGGTYYPKIQEKDYTIDLYNDSIQVISAKIRSQTSYKGAVLIRGNKRYRIKRFYLKKNAVESCERFCTEEKMIINDHYERLEGYLDEEADFAQG